MSDLHGNRQNGHLAHVDHYTISVRQIRSRILLIKCAWICRSALVPRLYTPPLALTKGEKPEPSQNALPAKIPNEVTRPD